MTTAGQPEAWNENWASPDRLFTRRTPRTLRQLWQRAYFEDLWRRLDAAGLTAGAGPLVACEQGSGRGTTSMYLAARGAAVTLVDLAPNALGEAKAAFAEDGLGDPSAVLADVRDTGLPSDHFDCVYNIGLLEHFDDPLPVLREAVRILKPGGVLFFVVVPVVPERNKRLVRALFSPWRLVPEPVKAAVRPWRGLHRSQPVFHRTEFTRDAWSDWMVAAGATSVEVIPYNPFHPPVLGDAFERRVAVPLYRAALAVGQRWGRDRGLQTRAGFELCDLVTGSK